jgi:hypothetical protein
MTAQKLILGFVLSAGLTLTASSAFAHGASFPDLNILGGHGDDKGEDHGDRGAAAPELAGHGSSAALALIAGGAAMVVSRRRRQG